VSELVKLISKKKETEGDTMDVLREVFAKETPQQTDPQTTTITKVEKLKIEQKEIPSQPQTVPEQPDSTDLLLARKLNLFRQIWDMYKGKVEIGNRLRPLLNPENLQTMTRLTDSEVDFVSDAHWLANQWKVFEPLRDLAHEICETNISEAGKGRQEAINFIGALTEGKLLKGLTLSAEMPKKSRFGFGKKEKEAEGEQ
jgi:hypothetical protein